MPRITLADLVRGTQGALVGGCLDGAVTGISIDSRTCAPGDAFFAIRGVRQDGHAFVGGARARGASAVVLTHLPPELMLPANFPVVLVDNTTHALQRLAAFHRRRLTLPVVGITGSNGKTTTKELTALVLSQRLRVLKAVGSFNNQWGVPLTLLALEPEHEAAVLEIGMNAFGEIAALAQIAQPSVGVVTSIAAAHLEGVGSLEGVQKAKGELVEAVPPDGLVVLNGDDPLVVALASRARGRVVTYGEMEGVDVRLHEVTMTAHGLAFRLSTGGTSVPVRLPLAGRHNAWNAAAAAAVGVGLGVSLTDAARALGHALPVKGRLVWREAAGVRILDDTYNANPASLRAALEALRDAVRTPGDPARGGPSGAREAPTGVGLGSPPAAANPGRTWVILGDMLELGAHAEPAHREAGTSVAALRVAGLATAGAGMRAAAAAARAAGCPDVAACENPEEAAAHVALRLRPGDRVLVKGSRAMRMERAVETLLARLGEGDSTQGAPC